MEYPPLAAMALPLCLPAADAPPRGLRLPVRPLPPHPPRLLHLPAAVAGFSLLGDEHRAQTGPRSIPNHFQNSPADIGGGGDLRRVCNYWWVFRLEHRRGGLDHLAKEVQSKAPPKKSNVILPVLLIDNLRFRQTLAVSSNFCFKNVQIGIVGSIWAAKLAAGRKRFIFARPSPSPQWGGGGIYPLYIELRPELTDLVPHNGPIWLSVLLVLGFTQYSQLSRTTANCPCFQPKVAKKRNMESLCTGPFLDQSSVGVLPGSGFF